MTEYYYRKNIVQKILAKRRQVRLEFVLSKVDAFPGMKIIDVGCGPDGRSLEAFLPNDYSIVGIDLFEASQVHIKHPGFRYYQQNAKDLSRFGDKVFDLAISVGMMEHITNRSDLVKMASEIDRVSRQYIIIVPWRYAWIEPHFKFPFFQLLPDNLKQLLVVTLNLHNLRDKVKRDSGFIKSNYQWLSNKEWQLVYKGATIFLSPTLETIALVKKY